MEFLIQDIVLPSRTNQNKLQLTSRPWYEWLLIFQTRDWVTMEKHNKKGYCALTILSYHMGSPPVVKGSHLTDFLQSFHAYTDISAIFPQ